MNNRNITRCVIAFSLAMLGSETITADTTDSFTAEVFSTSAKFCPRGSIGANGQLLAVARYQALFSLIGTTYGGNGRTTFALPDIRGRSPVHASAKIPLGARGGAETFAVSSAQMPSHNHQAAHAHVAPQHTHTASMFTHDATGANESNTPVGNSIRAFSPAQKDRFVTGNPNAAAMANGSILLYADSAGQTGTNAFDATTGSDGNGQVVDQRDPYLGILYCIVVNGIYPNK